MFHVGQLVVCVDADSGIGQWVSGEEIQKGRVYTIARVFDQTFQDIGTRSMVELVEVRRSAVTEAWWGHRGYGAHRFRPVNPKRIEVFTSLLVTPPKVAA